MTQREKLRELVLDFCNRRELRTFSLQELHQTYDDYSIIGIGGKTPQATIRRLLQELREDKTILFLDSSGNYTLQDVILDSELEELESLDISKEIPEKKEYLIETYVRNVKWAKEAKEILGTECLCKSCRNLFIKEDGTPYIEIHHILPLCEGGEDSLWNLSPVCAHHHRMAHFAKYDDRMRLRDFLHKEVKCRI